LLLVSLVVGAAAAQSNAGSTTGSKKPAAPIKPPVTKVPAKPLMAKPVMEYPKPGQSLDWGGSYLFKAKARPMTVYNYRFFTASPNADFARCKDAPQNKMAAYDPGKCPTIIGRCAGWRALEPQELSNANGEYGIHAGTPRHAQIGPGVLKVSVNAIKDGKTSAPLEFCVNVIANTNPPPPTTPPSPEASLTLVLPGPNQHLVFGGDYVFKISGVKNAVYRFTAGQGNQTVAVRQNKAGEFSVLRGTKAHARIQEGALKILIEEYANGDWGRRVEAVVNVTKSAIR